MNKKEYAIGLDLGTNSVGWAVVDRDYNLLKYKGQHMWGTRIFEEGKSAAATRVLRSARRRNERRKERIRLLQMLFGDTVLEKDDGFFIRLEESFLHHKSIDKVHGRDHKFNLFIGTDVGKTDKEYYKKYPTIYHLRADLASNVEKKDPRLIYLAMHHILKYRGNFLFEGKDVQTGASMQEGLQDLFEMIDSKLDASDSDITIYDKSKFDEIQNILVDNSIPKFIPKRFSLEGKEIKTKEACIVELFANAYVDDKAKQAKVNKFSKALANALTGRRFILQDIIFDEVNKESNPKIEINFSKDDDNKKEEILLAAGDNSNIVEGLELIYYAYLFNDILGGEKSISKAMVRIYEKHKKDLKILKNLFKKDGLSKEEKKNGKFYLIFNKKNIVNYASYVESTQLLNKKKSEDENNDTETKVKGMTSNVSKKVNGKSKKTTRDEFYDFLKLQIEELDDSPEKQYVLDEIEKDTFLPKINDVRNAAIPYQFHEDELKKIIENQKGYYSELAKNAEKILSILSFKRPYSVGVLYSSKGKSRFSWAEDIIRERVYPWNFNDLVDVDKMSENFISRMTNYCNYFEEEQVLPLCSITYQTYITLNELNKIRINRFPIDCDTKKKVFDELFCKKKSVSKKDLQIFLSNNTGVYKGINIESIEGLSDDNKFNGKMSTLADFRRILGDSFSKEDFNKYEDAVRIITLFNDEKIKIKQLEKVCGFDKATAQKLAKLNYQKWGRFSKKFLNGIRSKNGKTIIEELYGGRLNSGYKNECPNLNQLIYDEGLGFKEQVLKEKDKIERFNYEEHVKDLYCSPAVKRQIWQALLIIEEIVQIMGDDPIGIFIESTRKPEAPKKSQSRVERLKQLYSSIKEENDYLIKSAEEKLMQLQLDKNERLDNEKLYLYLLQLGRCMYSGEALDLDNLNAYEIDHIVPRSYIKDDSFENRVLVKKIENQNRSNTLGIAIDIITKQKSFWKFLYNKKFIGGRKYNNLLKTEYTEDDLAGFIARQLVETNQTTKAVKELLEQRFVSEKTDVQPIKAQLVSELRYQQTDKGNLEFIKLRNLNYMHHAKDAYLTATIGLFTKYTFPSWGRDERMAMAGIRLKEIEKEIRLGNYKNEKEFNRLINKRYSLIVDMMVHGKGDDFIEVEEGELINERFKNLLKTMSFNDCKLTKKLEFKANSNFYNQTIYPSREGRIPKKYLKDDNGINKPLAPELYGGFSGEQAEFMVVVRYDDVKKGEVKEKYSFEKIPVLIAYQEKLQPGRLKEHLEEICGLHNPKVVKKANKGQLIKMEGHYVTIASDKEVTNAVQLVLPAKYNKLLKTAEKISGNYDFEENVDVKTKMEVLANEIIPEMCRKIRGLYPLFKSIVEKVEIYFNEGYRDLSLNEKLEYINKLLVITMPNATRVDMPKKFGGGGSGWGRLQRRVDVYKIEEWVYQSCTGLYYSIEKGLNG